MPFFKLYGKRYHREQADYFDEVVSARSPKAALHKFALETADLQRIAEVVWDGKKPKEVYSGWLDPQPAFWAAEDELYKVRKISTVEARKAGCPMCKGSGKTQSYFEIG